MYRTFKFLQSSFQIHFVKPLLKHIRSMYSMGNNKFHSLLRNLLLCIDLISNCCGGIDWHYYHHFDCIINWAKKWFIKLTSNPNWDSTLIIFAKHICMLNVFCIAFVYINMKRFNNITLQHIYLKRFQHWYRFEYRGLIMFILTISKVSKTFALLWFMIGY